METKIIKVTNKGQISLPVSIRAYLGINQGDDLMMVQADKKIILKKIEKEDFSDLLKNSENVAKKIWSGKEDEIWDTI